eukprot:7433985-Heterocapsa_arctica.AAC.1
MEPQHGSRSGGSCDGSRRFARGRAARVVATSVTAWAVTTRPTKSSRPSPVTGPKLLAILVDGRTCKPWWPQCAG